MPSGYSNFFCPTFLVWANFVNVKKHTVKTSPLSPVFIIAGRRTDKIPGIRVGRNKLRESLRVEKCRARPYYIVNALAPLLAVEGILKLSIYADVRRGALHV